MNTDHYLPIRISDGPNKMPVALMRGLFEKAVRGTESLSKHLPLGLAAGSAAEPRKYADLTTDKVWFGFALGVRLSERAWPALGESIRAAVAKDDLGSAPREPQGD